MNRRSIKILRRIATLLLIGACINMVVAWALILRPCSSIVGTPLQGGARYESYGRELMLQYRPGELNIAQEVYQGARSSFSLPRLKGFEYETKLPRWSVFSGQRPVKEWVHVLQVGDRSSLFNEHSAGWPMLSCRYTCTRRFTSSGAEVIEHCNGIKLPPRCRSNDRTALPVLPIWPGFAVNTVLYAGGLALLSFSSATIRRAIRRRRHCCPACGYPVGESPVCTECGCTLPRR